MESTSERQRSQLLQAIAAMDSLQGDIERRRDNNLATIQKTSDTLHKCVDEQTCVLRQNVLDETAASLSLIKARKERLTALASKLSSAESGFTEEESTEINEQYAELQGGIMEEIYKEKCRSTEVSLPQLESAATPIYKTTELFLTQLDSVTSRIESLGQQPQLQAVTSCIDVNNCTVEDITVPKGKNSSFTVTLRDSEGEILRGYANHIKVSVVVTGKKIYETVHIEELPSGSYLVKYAPRSTGLYQVYIVAILFV